MKTQVSIWALLLSASFATSQTEDKPVTIRIKKIENINGVEKVTDSTYTTKGPVNIHNLEGITIKENDCLKDGKANKMVIVTNEINGNTSELKDLGKEDLMDEQIQRALKAAGVDETAIDGGKIVTLNIDSNSKEKNEEKKMTRIVIVKNVKITEASGEEKKIIDKRMGISDNELALDNMNFYPNPNNGKFHLNFNLSKKGNTNVNIFNMEGKSVYNEELQDFSGNYDKEMDISSNPKGVYFVKVKQGKHAQLKKIVIE